METPITAHAPPPIQLQDIEDAEMIVTAYLDLEKCGGWKWLKGVWEGKRDKLKEQILDGEKLSDKKRGKVRYAYQAMKVSLEEIEKDFQAAMSTLYRAGKLPSGLYSRLKIKPPEAPPQIHENFSPFSGGNVTLPDFLKKPQD